MKEGFFTTEELEERTGYAYLDTYKRHDSGPYLTWVANWTHRTTFHGPKGQMVGWMRMSDGTEQIWGSCGHIGWTLSLWQRFLRWLGIGKMESRVQSQLNKIFTRN